MKRFWQNSRCSYHQGAFARYLLSHGYIQSMKEAFDRYVGDHCPCFVPREKVTPAQAVELILGAGGVPCWRTRSSTI